MATRLFPTVHNDGERGVSEQQERKSPATIWLTKAEVAGRLRVSEGWVRDHASGRRRPYLPGVKMGKFWKFRLHEVEQWERDLEATWR